MDTTSTTSKFQSECKKLAAASYKCLEENPGNRDACQNHFDAYRECVK
ncbi:unnamed protein product, partial [Heterosigma akashiwo]